MVLVEGLFMAKKYLVLGTCLVCCLVPVLGIFGGSAGIAFSLRALPLDVIVCGLAILFLGAYYLIRKFRPKPSCCESPQSGCSMAKCKVPSGTD